MWTPQPSMNLSSETRAKRAASTRPTAAARPRATGSALILSLVTIVMLVMLGAAYLQVARTDRRTAAAVDTRTNQNEGSILRYIGGILASDVPSIVGADPAIFVEGSEYYDYPWSNPNVQWVVPDQFAPTVVPGPQPVLAAGDQPAREPRAGSPGGWGDATGASSTGNLFAQGGQLDDPWLAATEPDFGVTPPVWPHVTNLQGVFLDLSDIGSSDTYDYTGGGRAVPAQYLTTAQGSLGWSPTANEFLSDVAYTVPALPTGSANEDIYADADGDGITDSRWTWAPLPSDGGRAYVMAVRIVDNSSLLDLSAASYEGLAVDTNEQSRWLWPGELDIETALANIVGAAGVGTLGTEPLLRGPAADAGREMGTPDFNVSVSPHLEQRLAHWLSLTGQDFGDWGIIGSNLERDSTLTVAPSENLTIPDNLTYGDLNVRAEELELRWRNGLNRSDDNLTANAPTSLENLDTTLFRSAALEQAFAPPNGTPYATVQTFSLNEPRKQMTVKSGSANFGQININDLDVENLAAFIERDFQNFDAQPVSLIPPITLNANTPELFFAGGWGTKADPVGSLSDFAAQAAAVLIDFRDGDSVLTEQDGMYGMEYLPFMSEVYVQARYAGTLKLAADPPATAGDELTWTHTEGENSVAIELVNPWPWPIAIPEVQIIVDDGDNDTDDEENWGLLANLLPPTKTTMAANEFITFRKYDTDGDGGDSTLLDSISGGAVYNFTPPESWPVDPATGRVRVRLEALTNDGNFVTYQWLTADDIDAEIIEEYAVGTAPTTTPYIGYTQQSTIGTGNGIAALTVRHDDFARLDHFRDPPPLPEMLPTSTVPANAYSIHLTTPLDSGVTMFGVARKDIESPKMDFFPAPGMPDKLDDRVIDAPDLDPMLTIDPADEPWIIGNADRFYRTGDLLRAVFLGPRLEEEPIGSGDFVEKAVADVWADYFRTRTGEWSIRSAMLDLSDPALVEAGATDNRRMSHAAYLLGMFTNLESTRGLIPGRPNINTMPERLIDSLLPTNTNPESLVIAKDIIAARKDPASLLNRQANTKGIQTVSQLSQLNNLFIPFTLTPALSSTAPTRNPLVDFNEYEPGIGGPDATHDTDRFTEDLEERTMLMSYLNQVTSTRSDIFTAYVLVRAYEANDFSTGKQDEYRLIAVFDRSQVTGEGLPRILAVKRFADADSP